MYSSRKTVTSSNVGPDSEGIIMSARRRKGERTTVKQTEAADLNLDKDGRKKAFISPYPG